MLYNNVAATFFTDAEDRPTSKYFVYTNGVIRAKTGVNELHVRPGKNIAFVTNDNAGEILGNGIVSVAQGESANDLTITLGNEEGTIPASKVSSVNNNRPTDFRLTDQGAYAGGRHVGHAIVGAFNGGDSGITEGMINAAVAAYVNEAGTAINVENSVTVPIHEEPNSSED